MLAERIRRQLNQQFGIVAPEDWAEACIEWIQQENQEEILQESQVFDLVYEQWLLSDLRELGSASLPPGLAQQKVATLNGIHCLQVDSILDASQPYYGQLQKVKGTENENVSVSATQPTQPHWETKTSRMLTLRMTDGVQNIQGMEYRPIETLNTRFSPGVKVRLQGPVMCRVGMLMLQANNLQVLGGEVEGLVTHNTQETLLTNALNSKEEVLQTTGKQEEKKVFNNNEGEYQHNQRQHFSSNDPASRGTVPNPRSNVVKQEYQAPAPGGEYRRGSKHGIGGNTSGQQGRLGPQNMAEVYHPGGTETSCRMKSEITVDTDPFDDFPDDDILEAMPMDTMEPPAAPARNPPSWATTGTQHMEDEDKIAALMEDMPEEFLEAEERAITSNEHCPPIKSGQCLSSDRAQLSTRDRDVFFTATELRKTKPHVQLSSGGLYHQENKEDLAAKASEETSVKKADVAYTPTNPVTKAVKNEPADIRIKQESVDNGGYGMSIKQKGNHSKSVHRNTCDNNSVKPPAKRIKTEPGYCENEEFQEVHVSTSVNMVKHTEPTALSKESQRVSAAAMPKKLGVYAPPFTYLCFLRDTHPAKPSTFRVKAYISTLLSKLEYKTGYWSVAAKINDGSDSMDVDLGDEMLSVLIGFSAKECLKMRENIRKNPALKTKILQGIKGCQESLVQLSCILELELSPFRVRPYVLRHLVISREDVDALAKRQ